MNDEGTSNYYILVVALWAHSKEKSEFSIRESARLSVIFFFAPAALDHLLTWTYKCRF